MEESSLKRVESTQSTVEKGENAHKEKLLVMSNFFSCSVFKRLVPKNKGLFGKR